MGRLSDLSDIKRLGLCGRCERWYTIKKGENWLPEHKGPEGTTCPSSKYSYDDLKYHIKTPWEAVAVARFFREDDGRCLGYIGGGMHTLYCGDGKKCAATRLRWAKALAEYVLAHNES